MLRPLAGTNPSLILFLAIRVKLRAEPSRYSELLSRQTGWKERENAKSLRFFPPTLVSTANEKLFILPSDLNPQTNTQAAKKIAGSDDPKHSAGMQAGKAAEADPCRSLRDS